MNEDWDLQHRRRSLVIVGERDKNECDLKESQIWELTLLATWEIAGGTAVESTRTRKKGIGDVAYDLFGTTEPSTRFRLWISARDTGDTQSFKKQANWLKSIVQRRDE